MNIKPITIPPTEKYMTFGITTKKPTKRIYASNCWNEISEGAFKDYSFTIYNNYQLGKRCSTLIIFKKFGTWLKSKLKYIDANGNRKVLWSYRDDRMV